MFLGALTLFHFPLSLEYIKDQSGQDMGMLGISFGTNRTLIQAVSKGVFETYNLKYKNSSIHWQNVNWKYGY